MTDQRVADVAADAAGDVVAERGLFTGVPQHDTFANMQHLNRVSKMMPAAEPFDFAEGAPMQLPTSYEFEGKTLNLYSLLGATHTSALLVIKQGQVRHEQYWLTGGREVQWISMSVAKSFISAMVGIAQGEGLIGSLDDTMDHYIPALAGTAYAGVKIKDVLQMSSGARWDEDYSDPESEIFRLSVAASGDGSFDEFMRGMVRATEPGSLCMYNSADTQALGMLVSAATGRSITDYMQEKLYEPLGMESPGYWITDSKDREMAYAGLLLTARDFAKLGELYLRNGQWNGKQLVPADYVAASVRADSPHLVPGRAMVGDHPLGPGYGYQWWLPAGDRGDFSAIGVYNQFIYVDPARDTVIVKLSANPAYGTTKDEAENKDVENIEALRAISLACQG